MYVYSFHIMTSLRPDVARRLVLETQKLQKAELGGIHIKLNPDNLADIQAVIDGPENTPYEDGEFLVKLEIGEEFPQKPPKGFFLTKIFHPNVSEAGAICLSTLSHDWTEDMGFDHLFLTIRCLLIEPNPESALNQEAGKLLLDNYDEYCNRAKLMTQVHAKKKGDKTAVTTKTTKSSKTTKAKKGIGRL